jgi:hypothetical protein
MSRSATSALVNSLLNLGRDTLTEVAVGDTSPLAKHLLNVAQTYNELAGLLSLYPEQEADIVDAAGVVAQARNLEPEHGGGREALRKASAMANIARTAGAERNRLASQ